MGNMPFGLDDFIMSDLQQSMSAFSSADAAAAIELGSGEVLALGHGGGDIAVLAGRVWLTRSGDVDDHVLGAGDVLRVDGGGALVESWHRHAPAVIAWHPRTLGQRLRERFSGGA